MLSSMMRYQFVKGGAAENFGKIVLLTWCNYLIENEEQEKIAQNMLTNMMQILVEISAAKNQFHKT